MRIMAGSKAEDLIDWRREAMNGFHNIGVCVESGENLETQENSKTTRVLLKI